MASGGQWAILHNIDEMFVWITDSHFAIEKAPLFQTIVFYKFKGIDC